jgi:lipopolysaccharide/colanic/teichoic acid biosynthesis glycosyltransferase
VIDAQGDREEQPGALSPHVGRGRGILVDSDLRSMDSDRGDTRPPDGITPSSGARMRQVLRPRQVARAATLQEAGNAPLVMTRERTEPSPVLRYPAPAPAAFSRSIRKRALDIVIASLVLVLGSPAWIAIALLVRLTSPGPILFRQQRLGLGGVPFTCLKFRSMHDRVSEDMHREYVVSQITAPSDAVRHDSVFKLTQDPRVTGVGRLLRRTSLDEIPQFINVLRGEMSVVGPRPALEYEVEHYEPHHLKRLAARPGITGLWQVSGRNQLNYAEMVELDIQYIQTWSFGRDVSIVARTPWVMFSNSGGAA